MGQKSARKRIKVQALEEHAHERADKNFEVKVSIYDMRSADFWVHAEIRRAGPLFLQTEG